MEDDVQTIIALVSMSCPQILMKLVIMPAIAWDDFQELRRLYNRKFYLPI